MRHLQDQGIVIGIKVDKGLATIPGTEDEKSTQGLDGLGDRCAEYYKMVCVCVCVCARARYLSLSPSLPRSLAPRSLSLCLSLPPPIPSLPHSIDDRSLSLSLCLSPSLARSLFLKCTHTQTCT
jgi:hypothetical protein